MLFCRTQWAKKWHWKICCRTNGRSFWCSWESSTIHAEFKRAQTKKEPDDLFCEINTPFSAQTDMIFLLLNTGTYLHDTNPSTAHSQSSSTDVPDFHILKILKATGGKKASTLENNLKSLARDCIREHLKQINPEKNLYVTVTHLADSRWSRFEYKKQEDYSIGGSKGFPNA